MADSTPVPSAELTRVNDRIGKISPFGQFEIKTITMADVADTDTAITHSLKPLLPTDVGYIVIQQNAAGNLYHDLTVGHREWTPATIYLRSTVGALRVSLLLFVPAKGLGVTTLTGTITGVAANKIFAGPLTGSAAGPTFRTLVAADVPVPTVITVADTVSATCSVGLFEAATGNLAPKTDAGLTYNATTGVLTANGFNANSQRITSVADPTATQDAATKAYVDLAVSSLRFNEYFSKAALSPAVTGYYSLDTAQASADTITSADITGTTSAPTSLFKFMTPVGHPHLDRFLAGTYEAHFHLLKTMVGNKVVGVRFKLNQYAADGTTLKALLATSGWASGFSAANLPYELTASVAAEVTLLTTDRLSCEWEGYVISGANTCTVTLSVGGNDDSHIGIGINPLELDQIFVPYTGATHDADLGTKNLTAATLVATGGFGCNAKTAQTAYASGGALGAYGTGAFGLDSSANMSALHAMVVSIRAALVANGIMS